MLCTELVQAQNEGIECRVQVHVTFETVRSRFKNTYA